MGFNLKHVLLLLAVTTLQISSISTTAIQESIFDGFITININDDDVQLLIRKEANYRAANIGKGIPIKGSPAIQRSANVFSAQWPNGIELTLNSNRRSTKNGAIYDLNIGWKDTKGVADYLENCWDMAPYNWYGGGELNTQPWPIQNEVFSFSAYISGYAGAVVSPFFLSSESVYYFVKPENPLFVAIQGAGDNKTLCWRSEFKSPYRNTNGRILSLDYNRVAVDPANITAAYLDFISTVGKPAAAPSQRVIRDPIWSTWAVYKKEINQTSVVQFAQEIHDRGFPVSQIEIDDDWETCYGQEEFKPDKFPDPAAMVSQIKSLGYDVTLWVHPFVNVECPLFSEGDAAKYFVTEGGHTNTVITSWWDGSQSGYIDVTNAASRQWWDTRLQAIKAFGITSFKFDAGESSYAGPDAYLYANEELQPGFYSTAYNNFTKNYGGEVETRIAYLSQDQGGIFSRLGDRDSSWGQNNGLHSVITSTLHHGIIGYPFVLPDYIGGNAYGNWPDRELFIRWSQLNAFLPVLQFSILPWTYDDEVTTIVKNMITLHQNISDVIEKCVGEALQDGSPIVRPLWWVSPNDVTAQVINDQFLVGSTYLVAPIIQQGATQRDIYIPEGTWTDKLRGGDVTGPTWLYGYNVALQEIAYFQNTAA